MDAQAICAVLLRYADEVEPLKKQLEDVGVAIDEDHTTVASPGLVLCTLRPIERQPGNEEIPWAALPELCAGTPAHMLLPLLRATPVGFTGPASGVLVEDDLPRTSNGRTLHIRDPRAHGSLGCPRLLRNLADRPTVGPKSPALSTYLIIGMTAVGRRWARDTPAPHQQCLVVDGTDDGSDLAVGL